MNYIYDAHGRAQGVIHGRFIYSMDGSAVGQLRDTHVHKITGRYVGELYRDMIVNMSSGNLGNIGNPGNPGCFGRVGNPGCRGQGNLRISRCIRRTLWVAHGPTGGDRWYCSGNIIASNQCLSRPGNSAHLAVPQVAPCGGRAQPPTRGDHRQ